MSASAPQIIEEPVLLTSTEAGIATLTLNRPEQFNALSGELLSALQAALEAIGKDETIRVAVIAAQGRAFCAGHDLKEMRSSAGPDLSPGLVRPMRDADEDH